MPHIGFFPLQIPKPKILIFLERFVNEVAGIIAASRPLGPRGELEPAPQRGLPPPHGVPRRITGRAAQCAFWKCAYHSMAGYKNNQGSLYPDDTTQAILSSHWLGRC